MSKTLAAKKEPAQIAEERQSQLKLLIARGKEQGYLTYVEVNDHLPSEIVDPEQIEDIVNMINDMGIPVYEKAPDDEALLLTEPRRRRRRSRRRSRRRAGRARCRARPHHRPGAHVHARDGHGRAADARRRNPHRQAHRGRPRRRAPRAVELPVDDRVPAEAVRAGEGRPGPPGRHHRRLHRSERARRDRRSRRIRPRWLRPLRRRRREAEEEDEEGDGTGEEEEALETGPDPEEAARRFASIAKLPSASR